MKVRITMKDPDGVGECVSEAVKESLPKDLAPEEVEAVAKVREEQVYKKLGRWLEYREYMTVEFDLDAGTATVVPEGK